MTLGMSTIIHYESEAGRLRRERGDWKDIAKRRGELMQMLVDWYSGKGKPELSEICRKFERHLDE